MSSFTLILKSINKRFSDYFEFKDVNLDLKEGEVHALIGENGSGKSQLMKIIMGINKMDSGEIYLDGKPVNINSPVEAKKLGIYMTHQEPLLFDNFSIAENVFCDSMPYLMKHFKIINRFEMYKKAQKLLDELNFNISSETPVKNLGLGQRQFIDILKAYICDAKVIIMDEPTSALSENEVCILFRIISKLKNRGVSILYISHRLSEIYKISDRVTVIRRGRIVGTEEVSKIDIKNVIHMMTGMNLSNRYPKLKIRAGKEMLRVSNLDSANLLKKISFCIKRREIIGVTGLVGCGGSEIAKTIFGLSKISSGEIFVNNRKVNISTPIDAIKNGIGFISEDRSEEDVFMDLKISENITSLNINEFTNKSFFINLKKERSLTNKYVNKLSIKFKNVDDKISKLSGGNQQKVILAKLLFSNVKLFLLDEPTRGIDVASKLDVYNLMNSVVLNGASIIFISSDIDELMGMCDKIMVLCDGGIATVLERDEFSEEKIMYYATGGSTCDQ